jgi:deoxyribodipyrimidine photo-lyase
MGSRTKKVPNKFIHKPWEMELKYQQAIKTIIGKDYPNLLYS